MSNVQFLLPQLDELQHLDALATQAKKTVFSFNLSAKKIKLDKDATISEKYPFSIESTNGFTYQIIKDGKKLVDIQLNNEMGLEIKGDAKHEKLLKVFFMDETKSLYRSLVNQLTKEGFNQFFILLLGMKAMNLVKADIETISFIKAPQLKLITGDEWIKLVLEVIKDIAWNYFEPSTREIIKSNFERELRETIAVELSLMQVHIPSLEKAVANELKQITSSTVEPIKEDLKDITEQTEIVTPTEQPTNDIPSEAFVTRQEVTDLNYESLLAVIKEHSLTAYEHCSTKLSSKTQLVKYLEKKQWVIEEQPATVEAEVTSVETTEATTEQ